MSDNDYLYIIKILFQINGLVDSATIKDVVTKRISIIKLGDGRSKETNNHEYSLMMYITLSHDSHTTKGLIEIPYNNLDKAAFIAAATESINGIAGNDAKFSFLEIEDIISARTKIQARAEEILDIYKSTPSKTQKSSPHKRSSVQSILGKTKSILSPIKITLMRERKSVSSFVLISALMMFIASTIFLIQRDPAVARMIADYAYFIAALGVIWKFISYLRQKRYESKNNEKLLTPN